MDYLRIALAQINPTVGDLQGNARRIVGAMKEARESGADLVLVPELSLSGYPPEDLILKPSFLRDCGIALDEVVQNSVGIAAMVGFPHVIGKRVFNTAAIVSDGRLVGFYHKVELPNYGVFDEKRLFAPGSESLVLELDGVSVMPTVCEDVWVEGGMVERWARAHDVEVVLNISASPFYSGKLDERREAVSRFARRTGAFVAYCNLVGGQDELCFDGGSLVMNPQGEMVAAAKRFAEDLLIYDVAAGKGQLKAWTEPADGPRKNLVTIATASRPDRKRVAPTLAPELDRVEEIYSALVLGLGDYTRKNGFKKVVLGLSGGIDSALTAALAVAALGRDNVVGVTMPSQYSSSETRADAALLAGNLGISLLTLPIQPVFAAYSETLAETMGAGKPGLTAENLQARIRGNLLMALSNQFGWLVLTTGNKSETAVGYCTLYGDMAGGFAVIKDVPKTLVYELAKFVNQKAGQDLIPKSVFERPPTAELRPDQKDEDSLPPYATLDPILHLYVEEDEAPEEIAAQGFAPEIIAEVIRLVDLSEYKRRQAPPGIKITPKAFGRDRRLPITNRYRPR